MKRCTCILLFALNLLICVAFAESGAVEYRATHLDYRWLCEAFESDATDDAVKAFADVLLPGDEIVRGAQITAYGKDGTKEAGKSVLMAVRREEKMLLLAANLSGGAWVSAIESASFLPADGNFELTFSLAEEGNGPHPVDTAVLHTIVRGGEAWLVTVNEGMVSLSSYTRILEDGTRFVLDLYMPSDEYNIGSSILREDGCSGEEGYTCVFPKRLAAWTMDGFPGSVNALRTWEASHQPDVEPGEGYISGVNLRERPTGSSASMGEYTAKVNVFENVPGEKYPWYHVRVGDTDGWVSGRYLYTDSTLRLCELESELLPVARANADLMLRSAPDGETVGTMPAGTLMHVIKEKNGMLHVIVPRGEISFMTDWEGTYGFVPADGVSVGTSIADVMWK